MPGRPVVPGPGPGPDEPDRLPAYISAFSRCGADSVAFFWPVPGRGWQRIRLAAMPDRNVRIDTESTVLPHRLTGRELDVLTLLAIGLSNVEIANCLVSSPRTVSTHVEHILAKLGQATRTGAAAMAVERGLLRLPLPGAAQVPDGLTICQMHLLAGNSGAAAGNGGAAAGNGGAAAGNGGAAAGNGGVAAGNGGAAAGNGGAAAGNGGVAADVGIAVHGPPSQGTAGSARPRRGSAGHDGTRPRHLRIGSAFPLGGLAGDDGQQMRNGSALAVAELNARGGIGGRLIEHVVVGIDIFSADSVRRGFEKLCAAGVDGLTSGYVFPEDVAVRLAARYGAPYVHAMTSQSQAEMVRDNHSAFRNVFQVCPTEVNYGPGFIRFLDQARASGWRSRNRRIAVVETNLPSGQMLNPPMVQAAGRSGWEIAAARTVPAIGAGWAGVVSELERIDPAAVMIAQFLAGELAAFQRHACARLPDTLVYAIYAPSVPEFLQDAGPAAEGLVWATVTGTYDDSIGQSFRASYEAAFGKRPGWSHAGIAYDEVHLLAQAWRAVADPRDFAAVSRELRQLRYRGVNGAYFLDNAEQCGLSFPDTTPDPSLGQAHLVLQVQHGAHRIISPAPYAEAGFAPPGSRTLAPRPHGR